MPSIPPRRLILVGLMALAGLAAGPVRAGSGSGSAAAPSMRSMNDATIANCIDDWLWDAGSRVQINLVKAIETRAVITFPARPHVRVPLHAVQTADGRFRYESTRPDGSVLIQAFDGKVGWCESRQLGCGLIPAKGLKEFMFLDDLPLEARLVQAARHRRLLPRANGPDGDPCQVVAFTGADGVTEHWYFDEQNHRLRGIGRGGPGAPLTEAMAMTDYRPVEDPLVTYLACHLNLPFTLTRYEPGVVMVIHKLHITLLGSVNAKQFTPPAGLVAEARETDRILAHYLKACGGAAALRRIKTRITKSVTDITSNGMKLETTTYQKAPDLILTVQTVPGLGIVREGFDGHEGWAESEIQGTRKLQGPELAQLLLNADLQAAAHMPAEYPLRRLLPDQTVQGHRERVIRLSTLTAEAGTCFFDAASGQLVRSDTLMEVGPSGVLKVEAQFGDFRKVDGVSQPFVTTMTNPAVRSVTTILSVQDNVPIDDARFKMPAGD